MCTTDVTYFYSDKSRIQLSKRLKTEKLVGKAVEQLFGKGKVKGSTKDKMFDRAYQPLKEAVNEGYGKIQTRVEFGTPNYEFLKQLHYNAATFAAFKNHAQIKEMAGLLFDENGKRRTKEEFRKKALEVDDTYNGRHLDTEYDTAVRNARSAAQWQKAQTTKHLFPNIKYLPSVSANKREIHVTYYGMIRPMDDPIWNTRLPVNAWGCKCGWEVTDEPVTDIPDNLEEPSKEFAFNPGKTGQVFDLKESEYIKSVPPKEQPALIAKAQKVVDFDMAADLPPINVYASKAGTDVVAHPLAFDNADFQSALNNARKLANATEIKVSRIDILPTLHADVPAEAALRAKLMPGTKGAHNPDYRVDGLYMDLKEPAGEKAGKHTIQNLISKAHDQGDGVVLSITKDDFISEEDLYHAIFMKFQYPGYEGFRVYLYYKGQWQTFDRASFLKAYKKTKPR